MLTYVWLEKANSPLLTPPCFLPTPLSQISLTTRKSFGTGIPEGRAADRAHTRGQRLFYLSSHSIL